MESLIKDLEEARTYVAVALAVLLFIFLLVVPLYTRLRDALVVMVSPTVDAHNDDPSAHSNIRSAIGLLEKAVIDLQRQISTESEHRKESLEQVHQQLDTAIRLLRE